MTFGEAIEALKQDQYLARDAWHGETFIFIVPASSLKDVGPWPQGVLSSPCIFQRVPGYVTPWSPTHLDLLIDDWKVVHLPMPQEQPVAAEVPQPALEMARPM